jgi:osmotically-inducible protein OsmY
MKISPYYKLAPLLLVSFYAVVAYSAPGKPYSDEWYAGRIEGALAYNSYLDSTDLGVDVEAGTATIKGTVASDTERDLAEQITASVEGIKIVSNKIEVDPELAPRSRPVWLQKSMDATTTAAVKSRLSANKNLASTKVDVLTKDAIVVLKGSVANSNQKEIAQQIAMSTRDVKEVQNDLTILNTETLVDKAENVGTKVSRAVSDTWVSSKIRSSLLFSSDYPGSNISVHTNNGKVTLKGHVKSSAQSNKIAESVNEFVGVRSVENELRVRG